MALVHKLIKSFTAAKTFGDISKIVLATILKVPDELKHLEDMENVRIDLMMDRYSMNSVQDPEKITVQAGKEMQLYLLHHPNFKLI